MTTLTQISKIIPVIQFAMNIHNNKIMVLQPDWNNSMLNLLVLFI